MIRKKFFIHTAASLLLTGLIITSCSTKKTEGPFFGNGFRNGWADQNSIVLWTRLTQNPDMLIDGQKFIIPSVEERMKLDTLANEELIYKAQIPEGYTLDQMEGACPGATGEVMLTYYPLQDMQNVVQSEWLPVDPGKNFTRQWRLTELNPGTKYMVTLYARADRKSAISDSIKGTFRTPPAEDIIKNTEFCIVTCHDFIRRDDPVNGHKIYQAMLHMFPDFYVHTGDVEYYDKEEPYCMTEELMRFKWDRLFALPYQRRFFTQITTYFMKDDHDALRNDVFPGMTYGTVSFERGLEIFDKEQFPSNDLPYKTIRWGKDLQIWLVEGRNYRSINTDPDGPGKSIWGVEQKEWLFKTMTESDATFRVLITPTPILGPDRPNKNDNHANEGFQHEGDEVRAFLNQFDNAFICNGDRHWQYVTHIQGTNLWEFSCGAGSDEHAGGWNQANVFPEHRFLRVKGGFLKGSVYRENNEANLKFEHFDVDGNVVHTELFKRKVL